MVTMLSTRERVVLIALAEQGKFLEAIQEFYAEDAIMQENNQPPRVGLATLLENERRVLASLKEIRVNRANSFLVDGDRSAINWVYLFIDANGREIRRNEMAYQVLTGRQDHPRTILLRRRHSAKLVAVKVA